MIGIKKRKNTELSKEMNGQIPQTVKKSISSDKDDKEYLKRFMGPISSDKASKVHRTIHGASITAAGVGALPIPIADALILVPIQLKMLKNIYKIYDVKFSDKFVVNFIRVTLIPYIGRSLATLIPGVGSVVNASIAAAITEAIGWSAAASLEKGIDITKDTEKFEGILTDTLKTLIQQKK